MPLIKTAQPGDRRNRERLWGKSCAHFGAEDMAAIIVEGFWQRTLDPLWPTQAWLAESAGAAVGFAHAILQPRFGA